MRCRPGIRPVLRVFALDIRYRIGQFTERGRPGFAFFRFVVEP